jgi:streptomycin 6-kinase
MEITIKQATVENCQDINQILRLSKGHWGYSEDFLDRFMAGFSITEEYLEMYDVKLFLVDNEIAGYFNFITNQAGEFELDNFFLHPRYIGRGLGRSLWDSCCQIAKNHAKEFVIWSDPNAEAFYAKMGCERIGVRKSPTMPDRYPPVMKYKL